jgi:phosphopantetheinyl transferase
MEDVSNIRNSMRKPVSIPVPDYMRDHVYRGQAVVPAVESMRILAELVQSDLTSAPVICIVHADFAKFLIIDPGTNRIDAFTETDVAEPDILSAKLITSQQSGKSGITRYREHASLSLAMNSEPPPERQIDRTLGLEGVCLTLHKERIYRELVPFKAAYHNIEKLFISESGALALVAGGSDQAPLEPLGSPFPLDASFHAACVWGQRYAGMVGFPVHVDRRTIVRKTEPGNPYISRIIPVRSDRDLLVFDLWVYSREGDLCEEVRGLHMRDVSGRTLSPPGWIQNIDDRKLDSIKSGCVHLSVIELPTVTGPCEKILSGPERERYTSMHEKRARSFLAARLALKKISRKLSGNDTGTPANEITTVKPDGRPACPLTNGIELYHCSVSHDSRFAVAAASKSRVGIDVEEISDRVLNSRHLYMHGEELALVKSHLLDEVEASTRIWSIKEAVSKATGMNLAEAWMRTRMKDIGSEKSAVQVDNDTYEAVHAVVDGHIFTVITDP